jgi:penicillin-binding protein 2
MRDVVNEGYGTGKSGGLSWTVMCGKTGTAQWGPASKNQRLAWFAGFFPFENPRFAYAVIYEGRPGQTISGGRMAAPMVSAFFNPLRKEIETIIAVPKKAKVVVDEDRGKATPGDDSIRAIPVLPEDEENAGVPRALPVQPEDEETTVVPKDEEETMKVPSTDEQSDEPEKEAQRAIPVDDTEETGDEIEMTPGQ